MDQLVKQPIEQFLVSVDFSPRLVTGETITAPTVTARNQATGADTTGDVLVGSPTPSGTAVRQTIKGGAHGERHVVTFSIGTNLINTYGHDLLVLVLDDA